MEQENAHYMLKVCTCSEGPYVGARQIGEIDRCERCGMVTPAQWGAIKEMVLKGQQKIVATVAEGVFGEGDVVVCFKTPGDKWYARNVKMEDLA